MGTRGPGLPDAQLGPSAELFLCVFNVFHLSFVYLSAPFGAALFVEKAKVYSLIRGFLEFFKSGPDTSNLLQESPRAMALRAAAWGESYNKFEESGPGWRNSKRPLSEEYTFAYPRI